MRGCFRKGTGKGRPFARNAGGARDYRFICDADLSMPIEEINKFLPPQLKRFRHRHWLTEAPGASVTMNPGTVT